MPRNKYLLCARAVATHGVKGNLKLQNLTDSPKVLAGLRLLYMKRGEDYCPIQVESASCQKGAVLAHLSGIDTLEEAITYKGMYFYADRDDIPMEDGGVFVADLIGLSVFDISDGVTVGKVKDVLTDRVQDIYVVSDVNGGEFMIPAVPEFIRNVEADGEGAGVYVSLIDGMRGDS